MESNELTKFISEAKSLLNLKMSELEYEIWNDTFQHMTYQAAKDMVIKCYRTETGRITLSHLMKYKPGELNVHADIWDKKPTENCNLCRGYGCITLQRKSNENIYEYAFRCVCGNGEIFPYPTVTISELKSLFQVGNKFTLVEIESNASKSEVKRINQLANKAEPRKQQYDDRNGWLDDEPF